ncbi:hypothetical protein VTI74DRAFT_8194 [Chaetomium olivicolor]
MERRLANPRSFYSSKPPCCPQSRLLPRTSADRRGTTPGAALPGRIHQENSHLGYSASCGGNLAVVAWSQPLTCQGQIAYCRPDNTKSTRPSSSSHQPLSWESTRPGFADDLDPASPIILTAAGHTPLSLTCQDFTPPTTFCTGGTSSPFRRNLTSCSLLPLYSLTGPLPIADSCTIASIVSPAWSFSDFETNTTVDNSDVLTARLGMELQIDGKGEGGVPTGNPAVVVAGGVESFSLPEAIQTKHEAMVFKLAIRIRASFPGEIHATAPGMRCVTSGSEIRCAAPDTRPRRTIATSVTWA